MSSSPAICAILAGTVLAALLATVLLRLPNRHYRLICQAEEIDTDTDGDPDAFEDTDAPPPRG